MTQPTPTDAPRTLKATPELVDDPIGSLSPKEYVRSQEDLYNQYLADLRRRGVDFTVDTKTGTIKTKDSSGYADALAIGNSKYPNDPVRAKSYADAVGGDSEYAVDPIGSQYLTSLGEAELAMKRAAEDAAEAKKLQGSVQSYMDSEEDKTKEIQRQFKDFDARASLLYDLMGEEQDYAMKADDQNYQNEKAMRDMGTASMGYYGTPYAETGLSNILRPSLPDYVRPDYRLNAAVGLPGPEGFDDPDYNAYGMPAYAQGTDPNKPVATRSWPWRIE